MSLISNQTSPTSITLATPPVVKVVTSGNQAQAIAPLYCAYYKRMNLTPEAFVERWRNADGYGQYYLLAAYAADGITPCGFLDFSIIPSIFWAPCIARIDSLHCAPGYDEKEVTDALFAHANTIWNHHHVSKVIAVSCTLFEQESRLLQQYMAYDDNPTKRFFVRMDPKNACIPS